MSDKLTETIVWVPVTERLPKDGQTVLGFHGVHRTATEGRFSGGAFRFARQSWPDVTHWAEMPAGPSLE